MVDSYSSYLIKVLLLIWLGGVINAPICFGFSLVHEWNFLTEYNNKKTLILFNHIHLDGFNEESFQNSKDVREPLENDSGEKYFELPDSRRVTVSNWQGKVRVDLREYYEKDQRQLPGKKGLSLSLEQYEILKDLIVSGSLDECIEQANSK